MNGAESYLICCSPVIPPELAFTNLKKLPECVFDQYHSFNGPCNNPVFMNRGKESTLFIRVLRPAYADDVFHILVYHISYMKQDFGNKETRFLNEGSSRNF